MTQTQQSVTGNADSTQNAQVLTFDQALDQVEALISSNLRVNAQPALDILQQLQRQGVTSQRFYTAMANALMLDERQALALPFYEQALALNDTDISTLNGYGAYLVYSREFEKAEKVFRQVMELNPTFSYPLINLGMLLKGLGRYEEATKILMRGLELDPMNIKCMNNLGLLYTDIGDYEKAQYYFNQAIQLHPELPTQRQNLAMAHLTQKQWQQGWAHYEARLPVGGPMRFAEYPRWIGEYLPQCALLVLPEQGLGDMFLFARYLKLAAKRVGKVILICDAHWAKPLYRIFKLSETNLNVEVVTDGETLPQFDTFIPIASLPRVFANLYNVALHAKDVISSEQANDFALQTIPYMQVSADLQVAWRQRVTNDNLKPTTKKIGLVWQSGARQQVAYDFLTSLRSVKLADFAPLASLQDVVFYSLQIGDGTEQLAHPPKGMRIIDHTANIKDFADTAALLGELDALVSIDTSVPNLAGALGLPTFLLKSIYPDWRWFKGPTSPWYPSVQVFRQNEPNEPWRDIVARAVPEVERLLKKGNGKK